jgi:hypothetical protein
VTVAIEVARVTDGDQMEFDVTLRDAKGEARHHVTLSLTDFARLGAGATPEETIDAAFRFLLDRESKEAILSRFDVSVISRYFPEFEKTLAAYF